MATSPISPSWLAAVAGLKASKCCANNPVRCPRARVSSSWTAESIQLHTRDSGSTCSSIWHDRTDTDKQESGIQNPEFRIQESEFSRSDPLDFSANLSDPHRA